MGFGCIGSIRAFAGIWQVSRSLLLATALLAGGHNAQAFCGFYVGKADSSLFNEASQVILVRDGSRTVLSMLNDYKGALTEFALVVPVPTVLTREQINVGDRRIFDRIDAYSAPRLAEYHDEDPCRRHEMREMMRGSGMPQAAAPVAKASSLATDSVKVEATYTIGEYDIVILSATESDGLETWLQQNGYRVPAGASKALQPYIKQGLKFFVAKVNLKEQARLANAQGFTTLRPLQFAFESPRFMLPMRLGMVNSSGPQDLIVYVMTRKGRVEASNYRTGKLPANMDLPVFLRGDFKNFYKTLFDQHARRDEYKTVFTEYFWDMNWCDPCAANPLTTSELRQAGVFWLDPQNSVPDPLNQSPLPSNQSNTNPPIANQPNANQPTPIAPGALPDSLPSRRSRPMIMPQAQPVLLTRLHVRYTRESFPEDLALQQTSDRQNYQTRYVLRHPFKGSPNACEAAAVYYREVANRQEREAEQLAQLTGWSLTDIRSRMDIVPLENKPWWSNLWKG